MAGKETAAIQDRGETGELREKPGPVLSGEGGKASTVIVHPVIAVPLDAGC